KGLRRPRTRTVRNSPRVAHRDTRARCAARAWIMHERGGWRIGSSGDRRRPLCTPRVICVIPALGIPMSDDIPFNRALALAPGQVEEVAPGVRRLLCDNPSPFTFKGTMSYIVGRGQVAIVDPGPDDARHIGALLDAVRNETVTHILVTHTHRDHSPGAARVKAATGAKTYGEGPHRAARPLHVGEAPRLDASNDTDFHPDQPLADGAVVSGAGFTLEAIATPGHTANHMAFALREQNIVFSGDHVMGWSTSIVAPPDGAMSDYMASL